MFKYDLVRKIEADHGPVDAFKFWAVCQKWRLTYGEFASGADIANRLTELRGHVALKKLIANKQEDGQLYMSVWQRDCDMAEWTSRATCPADIDKYYEYLDGLYENAEGPVDVCFITKQEYDNFQRKSYDRALEAHEDGHPHVIYSGGPCH